MSYAIFYTNEDGHKMWLTSLGNENPLAGIGFSGGHPQHNEPDKSVPTTPSIEDAEKIIAYLHEATGTKKTTYQYVEVKHK